MVHRKMGCAFHSAREFTRGEEGINQYVCFEVSVYAGAQAPPLEAKCFEGWPGRRGVWTFVELG